MQPFREVLETDQIHVVDGAMGTMLYAKGVYINRCYDELNLTNPDLVREIHSDYMRAGADIIETNTFGATAHKLQQYGLEANLHEINANAARIARAAASDRVYVAGAIGPLGLRIEPYGPTSFEEAKDMFKAQAVALLEGGVDLFCLETFSDVSEIRQAIAAIRELCDLPSFAALVGVGMGMLWQVAGAAVMLAFPRQVAAIYTDDPRVIAVAVELLFLAAVFQLSDGLQVGSAGALRGIKDTRVPMAITVVAYWLVGLPCGYWLAFGRRMGAAGMWIGLIAGLTLAAVLLVLRFVRVTRPAAAAPGR
jgi:hypothetical protein